MSSETPAEFISSWTAWHTARERSVRAPHGIASLRHTHWLTEEATPLDGAPGTWRADATGIVGERLTGTGLTTPSGAQIMTDRVELVHGEELHFGDALLRGMERDGSYALRVLDPSAPSRVSLSGISAFVPDVAWIRPARFVPSPGVTVETESIDGHVTTESPVGRVELELGDEAVSLTVTGGPNGLWAVFSDGTSGDETYRFRFISMPAPTADGHVLVDFNRAYLPPCAFSDHYVCPLPASNNRLRTRITAGEQLPLGSEPSHAA